MAAYSFRPIRNPVVKRLLEAIFNATSGHDHDGSNSKAVASSTAISNTVGTLASLTTTAKSTVVAAINEVDANADAAQAAADARVRAALVTCTLAELNAGKTLIAGASGKTITIVEIAAKVAGAFAAVTSYDVQDTADSPVAIASFAVAGLTDGAMKRAGDANVTLGAGHMAALTADKGVRVVKNGSSGTGGTSITFRVLYTVS